MIPALCATCRLAIIILGNMIPILSLIPPNGRQEISFKAITKYNGAICNTFTVIIIVAAVNSA